MKKNQIVALFILIYIPAEKGNPTSYHNGTRWNYQWNGRQLTQAVVKGASTPSSFTYDENGLRVGKSVVGTDGTTQHTYLYDSDGTLVREIREYPGGSQDIMEYMYDQDGRPYAFVLNNTIYYYVLNLQGDVVRIVNTSGTTVASYTYNAYGKLLSTATTSVSNSATVAEKNPIRYRGYYYDNDIKLYYCQSRYYDPTLGRFLNPDAFTTTGQGILGSNMYGYCGNNPVNQTDSTGMFWEELWDSLTQTVSQANGYFSIAAGVALMDTPAPGVADIVAGAMLITGLLVCTGISTYSTITTKTQSITKTEEKVVAIPAPSSSTTVIYRYGGVNPGNLTPRKKDRFTGLSFSTIPMPGAAKTTIEAINLTGVVYAIQDGPTHVSVRPLGGTMDDWIDAGAQSIWTQAVKSVVIKWDGGY